MPMSSSPVGLIAKTLQNMQISAETLLVLDDDA